VLKPILKFLSLFYFLGLSIHRGLYEMGILKCRRLPRPVISIGNITWGGTGKTPLVEYIARFYLDKGKAPLIVSRGYGQDESKELASKLSEARFAIGKNRWHEAQKAQQAKPADVFLLDDGFQHWPLCRDLDIVMVNALNPFGNFSLLPRGILREPLQSLKRASLIVLNDVNLKSRKEVEEIKAKILAVSPQVQLVEAFHEPLYFYRPNSRVRVALERMKEKKVTVFTGVGMPRSFQLLLSQLGVKVIRTFEFCDHHRFSKQELEEIRKMKDLSESDDVITTEKDFFRCRDLVAKVLNPLVLKVRIRISTGEPVLHEMLERMITGNAGA